MPENSDIAVFDGEYAGTTPWEFDSIIEDAGNGFDLSTDAALHFSYGYKVAFGGTNDRAYGYKDFSDKDEIYVRYYFYYDTAHYPFRTEVAADNLYPLSLDDSDAVSTTCNLRFQAYNAGITFYRFYWTDSTGNHNTTLNEAISLDTRHYIDIHYKNGAGDGIAQVWLDGTSLYANTTLTSTEVIDRIRIGNYYGPNAPTNGEYFYIDDIVLNTTGPIGKYEYIAGHVNPAFTSRSPYVTFTRQGG